MAEKKFKKQESPLTSAPQTSVRMSTAQIETMLIHVIRLSNLFTIAKAQMPVTIFDPRLEVVYKKLWAAAIEVEKKIGSDFFYKPHRAKHCLWDHLEPQLVSDVNMPSTLKDYLLDTNTGLLAKTYDWKVLQPTDAYSLLKRFLRERLVQAPLWKKLASAEGNLLSDLPEMLHEAQKLDITLASMDADPVESGAPADWEPTKLSKFPTGIEWIDRALRGGHAGGEVYGVLGAYASGKTSLAVQLLYNTAKHQQNYADNMNSVTSDVTNYPKECYLFTYEATSDEIRLRLWSSACTIHHEHLEEYDTKKLSTAKNGYDNLHAYEKEFFKDYKKAGHKECIQGERERLETMQPMFRRNMWILDMSGTGNNVKRGTGYVAEIRRIIDADLERKSRESGRKHEVGVIVIDYAGLASTRHKVEHGLEDSRLRHLIGGFGDACKKELAVPLNCPVWVFHQLTGEANKRTSKQVAHYTDSAESKGFAENMAFCFALGTKDEEHNTLLFTCSKARRAKLESPVVLILEGEFFRLVESKEYIYDQRTKSYTRKSGMQGDHESKVENFSEKAPVSAFV